MAGFMHQDMADDQVEAAVLEIGAFGILLTEMHFLPHVLGTGVGIAKHGRGDIDRMDFGVRKCIDIRQGRMSHGTPHVEDTPRL